MCLGHVHTSEGPVEDRSEDWVPRAGITGDYELPEMDARRTASDHYC